MNKTQNLTNMTIGNPLPHIIHFSLPLLLGNLFQQLYNMVDSLVVGNYVGSNALAAVGTCGAMNFLFFSLSSGFAIGIGIIVSQYFGAHEHNLVKITIANALYVLIIASTIVCVTGILISPYLLRLLKTPDTILHDATIYMQTTCLGILAIALYNGVSAILRALGDAKTPLYFLILSSIVNVVLDLLFVLCFHWNVFGVAMATVISQLISALVSIFYAYQKVDYFKLTAEELKPNKMIIHTAIRLGIPVALQNSMIAISMMALQGVVNTFGETVMAAYTIVSRVEQFVQQPYTSLATAITTFSGQNMGAGKISRVKQCFHSSILINLIFSLLLIPITYLFGQTIIGFFVHDAAVISIGTKALRITSLCYFGLGMIYIPRAVLNGCGDTGFAMINGITEVSCRIIFSQLFTQLPLLGYWGIWITTGVTWIVTGFICTLRYLSGKWQRKAIIDQAPC